MGAYLERFVAPVGIGHAVVVIVLLGYFFFFTCVTFIKIIRLIHSILTLYIYAH